MLSWMLDAPGREIGSRRAGLAMGPEALALARKILPRARVGLLPMHKGISLLPVARRLAEAFLALGDSVHVLDSNEAPKDDPRYPAALERALQDASARARRVIVVLGEACLTDASASLVMGLDGVVLVSRPGGATEFRLHQLQRAMDAGCFLGVLMID
jgi:hypothetical protein